MAKAKNKEEPGETGWGFLHVGPGPVEFTATVWKGRCYAGCSTEGTGPAVAALMCVCPCGLPWQRKQVAQRAESGTGKHSC